MEYPTPNSNQVLDFFQTSIVKMKVQCNTNILLLRFLFCFVSHPPRRGCYSESIESEVLDLVWGNCCTLCNYDWSKSQLQIENFVVFIFPSLDLLHPCHQYRHQPLLFVLHVSIILIRREAFLNKTFSNISFCFNCLSHIFIVLHPGRCWF